MSTEFTPKRLSGVMLRLPPLEPLGDDDPLTRMYRRADQFSGLVGKEALIENAAENLREEGFDEGQIIDLIQILRDVKSSSCISRAEEEAERRLSDTVRELQGVFVDVAGSKRQTVLDDFRQMSEIKAHLTSALERRRFFTPSLFVVQTGFFGLNLPLGGKCLPEVP